MCGCGKRIGETVSTVARGAVGLTKAAIGLDRADPKTIMDRREICRACEHAVPCPMSIGKKCKCDQCGCLLKAKTVLAGESCPLGKWVALTVKGQMAA